MTTSNIRSILMKSITDLNLGKITIAQARAVTKQASAVNQSLRFDLENKRENIKLMRAMSAKDYKEYKVKALKL